MNSTSEKDNQSGKAPLRQFLVFLKPLWLATAGAIVSMIMLTVVNMATPLLVGIVFSRVFPERNLALLWIILGSLGILYLLRNFLYYQGKFTAMKIGEDVCFTLRTRLFDQLQQMRLSYTRANKPGDFSSKVMNDTVQIQQFIQDVLPKFLQAALMFGGIVIMIFVLNWQLALASTFILPLHFLTYSYFKGKIKKTSRQARENIDLATGNIIEKLLGVEVVKGFSGESREGKVFQNAIENSRRSQLISSRYVVLQKVCADILVGMGMIALIGFGAYQVIGKPETAAMQSGDFIAFFWYIRLLYPTVIDLMSSSGKLSKANASIERAFELLNDHCHKEPTKARLTPEIRGEIEFEDVDFSFSGKKMAADTEGSSGESKEGRGAAGLVLHGISFRIESGTVCAITGPSGAGKTTLVSLLPLLLEPSSGNVRIDGVDNREIQLSHLRQAIGIVFQECFLFNTTIMENLRYARPNASRGKIIEICEHTGADAFIRQLPEGYNSIVGENGIALSRGQKQLITLTRAMIKNPRIMILDEATASLDPHLENYVIPTILNLMKGRTTLMITHNPKLLEHADCEVCLTSGRIAACHDFQKKPEKRQESQSGKSSQPAV